MKGRKEGKDEEKKKGEAIRPMSKKRSPEKVRTNTVLKNGVSESK